MRKDVGVMGVLGSFTKHLLFITFLNPLFFSLCAVYNMSLISHLLLILSLSFSLSHITPPSLSLSFHLSVSRN